MKMDAPIQIDGKIALSDEFFARIVAKAEEKYKERPVVLCPYFGENVHLNARGLEHIKFKAWNKPRKRTDQYFRLKLLHLVPEVLAKSHTVQGIWETTEWERQKKHGKWEKLPKKVFYYEFVAVIKSVRIKVLIKEIEGGVKHFWSIIPFWKMNLVAAKRVLHDGNPETD